MEANIPNLSGEQMAKYRKSQNLLVTKKKPMFPIQEDLRDYLIEYNREQDLPISYRQLLRFQNSVPCYNADGEDTLWETVGYNAAEMEEINQGLRKVYAILKTDGQMSIVNHLYVDRIDYCTFGNSNPFRIRIVNSQNDNYDYYYIKSADASRVYGLELEHLLSPNRMHYLTSSNTLVEEHVVGIPGDIFIADWLQRSEINPVRMAKELIKFNERCFVRLLGDMRSYNFVVDITPDIEGFQIRIRCMDFDQQSYSGRKNFYFPQYFKENQDLAFYCLKHLTTESIYQYQLEEHALMVRRIQLIHYRLEALLDAMEKSTISKPEKVAELRESLAAHHGYPAFEQCQNMGQILRTSLRVMAERTPKPGDWDNDPTHLL
ncbi:MAG: hypothetical protein MI748_15095 [Opitutales bacterium]|nr:hypothetical protein [Opitutales bacterium]